MLANVIECTFMGY